MSYHDAGGSAVRRNKARDRKARGENNEKEGDGLNSTDMKKGFDAIEPFKVAALAMSVFFMLLFPQYERTFYAIILLVRITFASLVLRVFVFFYLREHSEVYSFVKAILLFVLDVPLMLTGRELLVSNTIMSSYFLISANVAFNLILIPVITRNVIITIFQEAKEKKDKSKTFNTKFKAEDIAEP